QVSLRQRARAGIRHGAAVRPEWRRRRHHTRRPPGIRLLLMPHGYANGPAFPQGVLSKRVERFAFQHKNWLPWIHGTMFVGFLVLVVLPLALPAPGDNARLFHDFTLTANFLIWGLWFPLVFVSVIFTGRSWCGVLCPMGASSEWANRIGLKRRVPRWIRWEGAPVVSFIVITILAQTVDARTFPEGIAVVFGFTLACALLVGFLYGPG